MRKVTHKKLKCCLCGKHKKGYMLRCWEHFFCSQKCLYFYLAEDKKAVGIGKIEVEWVQLRIEFRQTLDEV